MPQLFQVLRCYKCLVFQVHQTNKSNKFSCKLCGDKQSIKRHYGLGTAKDCRLHVQKLNGIRGEINEIQENRTDSNEDEESENEVTEHSIIDLQQKTSKWSEYVEKEDVAESASDNTMYLGNTEVVLDVPKKRCKTLSRNKNRKSFKPPNINVFIEGFSTANTLLLTPIDHSVNETPIDHSVNENNMPIHDRIPLECKDQVLNINSGHFIESKHVICKKEEEIPIKKLLPPIKNSSKWAQYVDTEEVNDDNDELLCYTANSLSNPHTFFSLCDDTDLDDVLNI